MNDPNEFNNSGLQGKHQILMRSNLRPLVVSLPEAAAMIGLSKNTARHLFEERDVPILKLSEARKVIRITDLERVLDEIAKEASDV